LELPANLLEYLNKYLTVKVPEKDVKDKILSTNPVPTNIKNASDLDSYIKELLVENRKTLTLHLEKVLMSTQEKIMDILGPLSKLWVMTENERDGIDPKSEDENEQFNSITELFEQTILLDRTSI